MRAGRDHIVLPLVWVRFADWAPLLQLAPRDLDPSDDGVHVSAQARTFSQVIPLILF